MDHPTPSPIEKTPRHFWNVLWFLAFLVLAMLQRFGSGVRKLS